MAVTEGRREISVSPTLNSVSIMSIELFDYIYLIIHLQSPLKKAYPPHLRFYWSKNVRYEGHISYFLYRIKSKNKEFV
jgi:hypothetical protein